jgi:biopolymer transport protein ExbD
MARPRRSRRVFSDINITPFTDVCLVLLIIFMVTATFLTQSSGMNVDLPKAASAQNLPPKSVEVTVTRDGAMYLDGLSVTKPQLTGMLYAKLLRASLKTVVIKADAEVPFRHVADAMDVACSLGAEITLAADLERARRQQK